ncbi:hypothetical protein TWF481_009280 [Arthrobotrys musiformis]|uniref:HNH nuclease domain-containing protein n=1 Tax=Arthrobotrys musiformis TaxID=47236 RepID=A0AAV9W344_9PEZI
MEKVATPFIPAREKHPRYFIKALSYLEQVPMLDWYQRRVLQSVVTATTNPRLLKEFPNLTHREVNDLAQLSFIALKNILEAGEQSSEVSGALLHEALNKAAARETPPAGTSSITEEPLPSTSCCTSIVRKLEISSQYPTIAARSFSRDDFFKVLCQSRERSRCVLEGHVRTAGLDAAHIFPFSLLDHNKNGYRLTWTFIVILLGEDLRETLVENLVSETLGVHNPANGLLLGKGGHE